MGTEGKHKSGWKKSEEGWLRRENRGATRDQNPISKSFTSDVEERRRKKLDYGTGGGGQKGNAAHGNCVCCQ